MATEDDASGSTGSILTRKTGPLPNWTWMALVLLGALVYAMWQRNRAAAEPAPAPEGPDVEDVPGDQTPPPVFILPQNPQPTVPININMPAPATPRPAPPGGGRPAPPTTPPVVPRPPARPAVAYQQVTVSKYTSHNAPWNSTLWGIARQFGYGASGNNWTSIWNDPKNATLKARRKDPKRIQPGDVIYVRKR